MKTKLRLFKVLTFTILYLLLSCKSKNQVSIPSDILPPDSMTALLADVHILQASAQLGYSENIKDTSLQLAYQSLWRKHNLTENSYNKNMLYYCNHPKLLDSVYEKVLGDLNQRKAELMGPRGFPHKAVK
jgi:hypothetical protein